MALAGAGVLIALIVAIVIVASGSGHSSRGAATAAQSSGSGGGTRPSTGRHGNGHGHARSGASEPGRLTASQAAAVRHLAGFGLPVYCAGMRGNAVAFTFDDGPGPYTHLALRKLAQAHERATFFVVGRSIDAFPGYLPSELKLAALGDHSYTHPVLSSLAPSVVSSELSRTIRRIESDGGPRPLLFRPPYGARNTMVDGIAKQLGLLQIVWNVDSADSLGANYAGIIRNVEAGLHPGSIILMHENRGQTIRALTTLLPELHRRHLRSVTVPELLASDPPSRAQLERGAGGCSVAGGSGSGG